MERTEFGLRSLVIEKDVIKLGIVQTQSLKGAPVSNKL